MGRKVMEPKRGKVLPFRAAGVETISPGIMGTAESRAVVRRQGWYDDAVQQVTDGNFKAAIKLFEKILEKEPQDIPSHQYLALVYIYQKDYVKAQSEIALITTADQEDPLAVCLKAIMSLAKGNKASVTKLTAALTALTPKSHQAKLWVATTLGSLGLHQEAYTRLQQLHRTSPWDLDVLHYLGIAAYFRGKYDEAFGNWQQILEKEPGHILAAVAMLHGQAERNDGPDLGPLDYRMSVVPEQLREVLTSFARSIPEMDTDQIQAWMGTDMLLSMLRWGFRQGGDDLRRELLGVLETTKTPIGEPLIRALLTQKGISSKMQTYAMATLYDLGVRGTAEVRAKRKVAEMPIHPGGLPEWRPEWEEVLDVLQFSMVGGYAAEYFQDGRDMWLDYLGTKYPEIPKIYHASTWAAGLEYAVVRFHFLEHTQEEVARLYHTSVTTLRNRFKEINTVIQVVERAHERVLYEVMERALEGLQWDDEEDPTDE